MKVSHPHAPTQPAVKVADGRMMRRKIVGLIQVSPDACIIRIESRVVHVCHGHGVWHGRYEEQRRPENVHRG